VSYGLNLTSISCELVACQVKLSDTCSLIVCSIYRPPSSNDYYLKNLCEQLECIKRSHPNSAIWISGDINLPDINRSDNFVDGHSYSLRINNIFLDFLNSNGLTQIVKSPTRGSNILDIFVTNRPSVIESCETVDGISDHEAFLTKSPIRVHLSHPVKRPIYLWSHADFSLIKQTIQNSCEQFISTYSAATPVNILWDKFSAICAHGLSLITTKLTSSRHHQPWITRYIKQLTQRKQQACNCARLSNLPQDRSMYYDI